MNILILAAGNSSRMLPITTKKPYIKINGKSNIERIIDTVKHCNYPCTIFLAESIDSMFNQVKDYNDEGVYHIINKYSKITNNMTTLIEAYQYISERNKTIYDDNSGVVILEGDQVFDEGRLKIILKTCHDSKVSLMFTSRRKKGEWKPLTKVDDVGNRVYGYEVSKKDKEYCMSGAYYLTYSDYHRICFDALTNTSKSLVSSYWEEYMFSSNINIYEIKRIPYSKEMDDVTDLIDIIGYDEVARLITDKGFPAKRISESMTNRSYYITYKGVPSVLRLPGIGTDQFINHIREVEIYNIVKDSVNTPTALYYSKDKSVKICDKISATYKIKHSKNDTSKVVEQVEKFHKCKGTCSDLTLRDIRQECHDYIRLSKVDVSNLKGDISYCRVINFLDKEYSNKSNLKPTHGDLIQYNILFDKKDGSCHLIDLEYAGYAPSGVDYGSYISEQIQQGYQDDDFSVRKKYADYISKMIKGDTSLSDKYITWSYVIDYLWGWWGLAKTELGDDNLEYGNRRLNYAKNYFKKL